MVDMGSISAAVTSLKAATDIAKGIMDLKTASDVQSKVIELQGVILGAQSSALAAQSDQMSLLEEVRQLKEDVTRLEAWNTEKERYKLTELAPGVLAYTPKEGMRGTEPDHALCANCYEERRKSVLQAEKRPGRSKVRVCHHCGSILCIEGSWAPVHSTTARRR